MAQNGVKNKQRAGLKPPRLRSAIEDTSAKRQSALGGQANIQGKKESSNCRQADKGF